MTLPAYKLKGLISSAVVNAASFLLNSLPATIVLTNAGAPTNGTTGTGAGVATRGQLLTDTTNGELYINTGSTASPTWSEIAHA